MDCRGRDNFGFHVNICAPNTSAATALPGAVAMAAAFAGMFIGQAVRSRMPAEAFRRWFLITMIFLGIYLTGSAIYSITR